MHNTVTSSEILVPSPKYFQKDVSKSEYVTYFMHLEKYYFPSPVSFSFTPYNGTYFSRGKAIQRPVFGKSPSPGGERNIS
jgi:hypothetical protein